MKEERLEGMNIKLRIILICISMLVVGSIFPSGSPFVSQAEAFSKATLNVGSRGADVKELQGRLKFLGYYKSEVDGVFGWGTYNSLKRFQRAFGLKADGIAGSSTKNKLWSATKKWKPGATAGGGGTKAAATGPVLKQGSSGGNVWDLQGRLKYLGYYKGTLDGKYGRGTRNSVYNFQKAFGLKGDGIAGPTTRSKLKAASPKYNAKNLNKGKGSKAKGGGGKKLSTPHNNRGFSANDLKMMANAVYGEARGEPYEGQVAVAAVILNRIDSPLFPNTVNGVIFQPGAFTAVADGQIWLTPNERAKKAVQDAINGWDPAVGCLYYFNPVTATSKWIWTRPQVKKIGKHIFAN
jgi:N-acetylmuramoyl-L-alanine amidase